MIAPTGAVAFVLTVLDVVPDIVKGVGGAIEAFTAGHAVVKKLVEEDRDPTPEEWDRLNSDVAALRDQLHTD